MTYGHSLTFKSFNRKIIHKNKTFIFIWLLFTFFFFSYLKAQNNLEVGRKS